MNRFYNYIGVRNTGKNRILAVVCSVMVALTISVNALAQGSWFRKSYVVVNYSGSTDSYFLLNTGEQDGQCTHGNTAFNNHDFGFVDKLYLKKFVGSGWYADNHDISSMHGWYRVYKKGSSAPSWHMIDMNNYDNGCEHKINHIKSWYSNNNTNLLSNLDAGRYYFETAMSMWETYSGGQYERMIPGNGQYNPATSGYNSTFAIRGFVASDVDFRRVSIDTEHSKDYTFYAYGWSENTCTAVISGTDAACFSFVSGTYDVASRTKSDISISDDQSEAITIYFNAPNEGGVEKTAKITLSGTPDGKSSSLTKTITITASTTNDNVVLYLADSVKTLSGPYVKFSAYVRSTGCNIISDHGFQWGTTSGTYNKTSLSLGALSKDAAGTTFTGVNSSSSELSVGNTYYYRAYAVTSNDASNPKRNQTFYSPEGSFTLYYECDYPDPVNDMLDVYINNTSGFKDKCNLRFESIKDALTTIRGISKYYSGDDTSGKLLCNVRFHIENTGVTYQESDEVGDVTGGSTASGDAPTTALCIKFENFNNNNPNKRLILTGKSKTDRPTLLHPVIRNSRNIDCRYLIIKGSDDGYTKSAVTKHDNAIDIDNGSKDWTSTAVGAVSNGSITFNGCYIKSKGFTCMHISAYDDIAIEDCDLNADYADGSDCNSIIYGSSIKLIHCKNIKLLRNNFRGSHATSTWIQGCNNILLMNNVYWNNNTFTENVAFIRLVCQTGSEYVKNVGMYYNTLYLANAGNDTNVDFLRLGTKNSCSDKGPIDGNTGNYEYESIEFKFNNCYSYDEDVAGKTDDDDAFLGILSNFCGKIDFNNFWSEYDENAGHSTSDFEIKPCVATTSRFINVSKAVCETAASDPSSLVLKTDALNLGTTVTTDVSGLGADEIHSDRLHEGDARPATKASGGGTSKAGVEGANGTIKLTVNDNISSASKDIDLAALGVTPNSTITCTLSGSPSKFSKSHNSFTVDGFGKLSTKVFTITFNKPASAGTYEETLTFSTIAGDGPRTITINLVGVYSTTSPIEGGWTLGAYQMSHGEKVSTIIWNGGTEGDETSWDNRNNWRKLDGSYVTCVDLLTEDLKVIIPAPEKLNEDDEYPRPESGKITSYPIMPEDFNTLRKKDAKGEVKYGDDIVNAGQNIDGAYVSKYAHSIQIQSGGAIKGVEYLHKDGVRRYDEASNTYLLPRSKWLLVGTVIKPFTDGRRSAVRNVKSGDYYMDAMPQVYMHESLVDEGTPSWNKSFPELDKEVAPDKVFAVYVPNQYGKYKISSELYSRVYPSDGLDPNDGALTKSRFFSGWFQNESELPSYTGLETSGSFCSNTYPANLDVYTLKQNPSNTGASIQLYNSDLWSFEPVAPSAKGEKEIKSQSGFFVTGVTSLTITQSMFTDTETMYKNAGAGIPYCSLLLQNPSTGTGCIAGLRYDELKTDTFISGTDAPKVFITTSGYESVPDLYLIRYGKPLSMLFIPTLEEAIPLGVKLKQNLTVRFSISESRNFEKAELTDVVTGTVTNLLKETYTVDLAKGEYEERFYLNLKTSEDVPTDVKEHASDDNSAEDIIINATMKGRVAISSTNGVTLKEAYVTDMAGRTFKTTFKNDHYNEIKLNGADGVYIVKVVGDVMNKTEKVILK